VNCFAAAVTFGGVTNATESHPDTTALGKGSRLLTSQRDQILAHDGSCQSTWMSKVARLGCTDVRYRSCTGWNIGVYFWRWPFR
jgi:hypothetical protein